MKIVACEINLLLSREDAEALRNLIGAMSRKDMDKFVTVSEREALLLIFHQLADYLPEHKP